VRAPREELEETLEMAVGRLSRLPGIVVEGNSAIEVLRPDIVIFISEEPQKIKKSALAVLGMADLLKERAEDGNISCADAWKIAGELGVPKKDVGRAADEAGVRIQNCQLGCF
jgi:LAO/AO transport system kinase